MKIKKMTATFGGLERATLTPGDGLTVITAPNEGGKSTWAAFLRAMFYGIDTRDRDKAGYLADKNRYQPWSGAPMSGEIELEWEGRDITIRRTSTRTGPMQQFQAVYTATGDPVPGLTGANVGQQIMGVSRDVFVRSAFVGQNSSAVTPSGELESRVAALATSGEEDVSASATQRTLKDWRNRRQSNRSNGLIPELERELNETRQTLRELEQARGSREAAKREIDRLTALRGELEAEREIHRKLAGKELNRRCGEALARLEEAEARLNALPAPDAAFEGMTAEQARTQEETLRQQAEDARRALEENSRKDGLLRRRKVLVGLLRAAVILLGVGGLGMVIGGFVARVYPVSFAGFGAMCVTLVVAIALVAGMGRIDKEVARLVQAAAEAEIPRVPSAESYIRWLGERDALTREVRHCRERYDDLTAQGAQPLNTLELLHEPQRSATETAARLSAVERELGEWQSRFDRAVGALHADPVELEARCGELESRLEQRTAEYKAIDLAIDVLAEAESALRERFSPALNREAAKIFAGMTGGKYTELTLSRDFTAMTGGTDTRSALYLSAGTVDQLYLSVRLALCRLTVPGTPILLDDALCAFDDSRMVLALEALRDMAEERQILLFTCQSREGRWAEENGVACLNM